MGYLDFIAMGVFLVVTWAACAVAAGTMLWFVGVVGYGVAKVWERFNPPARQAVHHHPGGRKHGRRVAAAATAKTFVPMEIRRRVFPLI